MVKVLIFCINFDKIIKITFRRKGIRIEETRY